MNKYLKKLNVDENLIWPGWKHEISKILDNDLINYASLTGERANGKTTATILGFCADIERKIESILAYNSATRPVFISYSSSNFHMTDLILELLKHHSPFNVYLSHSKKMYSVGPCFIESRTDKDVSKSSLIKIPAYGPITNYVAGALIDNYQINKSSTEAIISMAAPAGRVWSTLDISVSFGLLPINTTKVNLTRQEAKQQIEDLSKCKHANSWQEQSKCSSFKGIFGDKCSFLKKDECII